MELTLNQHKEHYEHITKLKKWTTYHDCNKKRHESCECPLPLKLLEIELHNIQSKMPTFITISSSNTNEY